MHLTALRADGVPAVRSPLNLTFELPPPMHAPILATIAVALALAAPVHAQTFFGRASPPPPTYAGPFNDRLPCVDRIGRCFDATIAGQPVALIGEKEEFDALKTVTEKANPRLSRVYWIVRAPVDGRRALTVVAHSNAFGRGEVGEPADEPEVMVYPLDGQALMSKAEIAAQPGVQVNGMAAVTRQNTLQQSALPAGRYVFSVRYNGTSNWDRKWVFLTVAAGAEIAAPAAAPSSEERAANAATPVVIKAHWKLGDQAVYDIAKTTTRPGKPAQTVQLQMSATVVKASATGFELRLMLAMPVLPDISNLPAPAATLVEAMLTHFPREFLVATDETGNIESLLNWQSVASSVETAMSATLEGAPPEAKAGLAAMKKLYADEASTRMTVLNDLDFLFTPLGDELVPGQVTTATETVEVPLLGPLAFDSSYRLDVDQPVRGQYRHQFSKTVNEAAFRAAFNRAIAQLAPAAKRQLEAAGASLQIQDRNETVIDVKTGWVLTAERTRRIKLSGSDEYLTYSVLKATRR